MSAEELPIPFRLGYYRAPPQAWPHRTIEDIQHHNEDLTNGYGLRFYDWIVELAKVPPGELSIQRCPEDEFPCLECGIPADDVAMGCGATCFQIFKQDMREIYSKIRIRDGPAGTGQGAFLGEGSFEPPIEYDESPTEHHVVGMYIGRLFPEVPNDEWKDSAYVLPINGADYQIQAKMIPNGFKPRWGGPYKIPRRTRYRSSTLHPAYDTETYTVMIDAKHCGNWTRFVNSSCDPNLALSAEQVGKIRVMVFKPLRKITAGEELTFYYGREFFRCRGLQCRCSAYRAPHLPENIHDEDADAKFEELPPGLAPFRGISPSPSPSPLPTPPPLRVLRQRPPREPPKKLNKRKRTWDDEETHDDDDDDPDYVDCSAAPRRSRRRLQ